ncbi:uncharacterized protein TA04255 [Theileria annulata]|uniref:Uncharacterized protein n=1 Tax=Theileria annulata TaxID=5874 RepID=Q4UC56_THEAN|nr:uncharacterized protein TA04255 [Theileria annulata]CAI75595.1 hypothetical protein, conserved [Theileria annulata]|eukprot:XP_955071.1 hypothetical protein, conserved [Theileria annulata]
MASGSRSSDSDWITSEQSREITMLALRKGAALQKLVSITSRNSASVKALKNALFKMKVYAFGEEHQATISSGEQKGSFRFSQVQLKLLRQEQLMLLSENQRLIDELQKIRKLNIINNNTVIANRNAIASRDGVGNNSSESVVQSKTPNKSKLLKCIDKTLAGENEVNLMKVKLLYFVTVVDKAKQRIQFTTLRRLSGQDRAGNYSQSNLLNPQRYYTLTKKAACILVELILERKVKAQLSNGFNLVKQYNSEFKTMITVNVGFKPVIPNKEPRLGNLNRLI